MRVLLLTRYGRLGASSRLRSLQYLPYLQEEGLDITVSSLFDDRYLTHLYQTGRRSMTAVIDAYARRAGALLKVRRFSVVWLEKELFPFLPGIFEGILAKRGVPYIVDYDDAIFHKYDEHSSSFVRITLGKKLNRLLKGAQRVTVGNQYLEEHVRARGARNVDIIPTVVDTRRYQPAEPARGELRIGWIGSPSTAKYLQLVRRPLQKLSERKGIRLVTIGAPPMKDYGVPLEQHRWTEESEARILSTIHVGIMPLPDEPWERGKCAYKLLQYMACGKPVVASPVGVNAEIVINGGNGMLAATDGEWIAALAAIQADSSLGSRLGAAGRDLVLQRYSLAVMAPKVKSVLQAVHNTGIQGMQLR